MCSYGILYGKRQKYKRKQQDKFYVFYEGLVVLLLFNYGGAHLEQFVHFIHPNELINIWLFQGFLWKHLIDNIADKDFF